jgi:hypothetical protein
MSKAIGTRAPFGTTLRREIDTEAIKLWAEDSWFAAGILHQVGSRQFNDGGQANGCRRRRGVGQHRSH